MKHSWLITLQLLAFFVLAQLVGLTATYHYVSVQDGQIVYPTTAFGEPSTVSNQDYSFIFIMLIVLIGTSLMLLLIKFRKQNIWPFLYYLAVFLGSSILFGVFFTPLTAYVLGALLTFFKAYLRMPLYHNLTEIIVYSGATLIMLPLLNLFSIVMLLLCIAVYDYIAVFKTKHMITLAQSQQEARTFAGLSIPTIEMKEHKKRHSLQKETNQRNASKEVTKDIHKSHPTKTTTKTPATTAILGGGDVIFPLLFNAVLLEVLLLAAQPLVLLLLPILTETAALFILFYTAQQNKHYPAMPMITFGCLLGLVILLL